MRISNGNKFIPGIYAGDKFQERFLGLSLTNFEVL